MQGTTATTTTGIIYARHNLNDAGMARLTEWLNHNHKRADRALACIDEWADSIVDSIGDGNGANVEIKSWDSRFGHTENLTLSCCEIETEWEVDEDADEPHLKPSLSQLEKITEIMGETCTVFFRKNGKPAGHITGHFKMVKGFVVFVDVFDPEMLLDFHSVSEIKIDNKIIWDFPETF